MSNGFGHDFTSGHTYEFCLGIFVQSLDNFAVFLTPFAHDDGIVVKVPNRL